MKFCCPKCRREEEIIGDTKPKCLICNVGMVQATASYKGLWMNPHFVIARMKLLIEKYGYHDATTNGGFKKEREAWTSGMYALGLLMLDAVRFNFLQADFWPGIISG